MLMHQSLSAPVRVVGLALAIAAASLIADIASAKEQGASTVVSYSDLDLNQSSDAARLYARLKYASKKVCNSYDTGELRTKALYASCYDAALSKAVAQVDDVKLSSLHAAEPRIRLARKSG